MPCLRVSAADLLTHTEDSLRNPKSVRIMGDHWSPWGGLEELHST